MNAKQVNFYKFSVQIKENCDLLALSSPGIFGVQCNKTERIIILGADESLLFSMQMFFQDVLKGLIDKPQLLIDLQKYGKEVFTFFLFDANIEFENPLKMEKLINDYKNLYKQKLY